MIIVSPYLLILKRIDFQIGEMSVVWGMKYIIAYQEGSQVQDYITVGNYI